MILGPDGRPAWGRIAEAEKRLRFNPLSGWTPAVLTRQLAAYAQGYIAPLCWVMEWLEAHDDTIAAVAHKSKAAVSRHGWDVVLRDEIAEEDKALAQDQQGRLQEFYARIQTGHCCDLDQRGGMRLLVNQVMDGYGKGFSAHHVVWRPEAGSLAADLTMVPAWLWENTGGTLRFLESTTSVYGTDRASLGGESAWLISKGRGVMLACAVARMFKQIPLQDWLTYCDRHGMPAFLGKTSAAKGSEPWNEIVEAVQSIGSEFAGVVNSGDTIEVLNLTAQGQVPYEKLIDRMDRAIVMLWRGGDLSTLSRGGGAVGSNPQQEETDELDADNAAWVGETIDGTLTPRVLEYYFGPGTPQLAQLRLRTKTRENVERDLKVVQAARDLGVRISRDWFVSKFGLVTAEEGEQALGETAPPAAPAAAALNTGEETRALVESSLAKALGVRAAMLAPLKPALDSLAAKASDRSLTDADFAELAAQLAESLPELADETATARLAAQLEAAMGTAVLQGAREAIRENTRKDTP